MNNIKKIKAIIAGPNKFKLLINASHSLVNAPAIIITNKIVEIKTYFPKYDISLKLQALDCFYKIENSKFRLKSVSKSSKISGMI